MAITVKILPDVRHLYMRYLPCSYREFNVSINGLRNVCMVGFSTLYQNPANTMYFLDVLNKMQQIDTITNWVVAAVPLTLN